MEDDLNMFPDGRRPKIFGRTEEDLNYLENERRPQLFRKFNTPLIVSE